MKDWTEQEEQEMIELAKTGDPRANYELSLWALERGEEEPDEPRWNRLAAKCLVKAAQAGYGPAQERMEDILQQQKKQAAAPSPHRREPEAVPPEPVRIDAARGAQTARPARQNVRRPAPAVRRPVREEYDEEEYDENDGEEYDDELDSRPFRGRSRSVGSFFSGWTNGQWRKLEMVCIGICAVLLIAIAAIFISSRSSDEGGGSGSSVPQAGQANPAGDGQSEGGQQTQEEYPTEDIISDIHASGLEVLPGEQEYVTAPTTATVSVGNTTLRLRIGPSTTYSQVKLDDGSDASMPDGTKVDVYAKKGDWWLLKYQGKYGWSSKEYLIEDAGAASVG